MMIIIIAKLEINHQEKENLKDWLGMLENVINAELLQKASL